MAGIKSIDKLREKIRLDVNNPWSDLKGDLLSLCDKVEREIAERYMELPTDADGVPIRVGDKMQYLGGEPFIVCAVAPCFIHTWMEVKLGERMTTCDYEPLQCTHYKPRTVEDVLREFAEWFAECVRDERGGQLDDGDIEGFADEIRGLLLL